ncbi:MAG: RnfH family protein [Gammaproteobacteria bacterium]|nr:RnfH family protein [Gammaproteobacteria bacterium]
MKSTETVPKIEVEVAYAEAGEPVLTALAVPQGTTLAQLLDLCAAKSLVPEVILRVPDVGVFGRRVAKAYALRPGDRVEFYRPLKVDPKAARRLRAGRGARPPIDGES